MLADAIEAEPSNDVPAPAESRPVKRVRKARSIARPPGESDELSARIAKQALCEAGFVRGR